MLFIVGKGQNRVGDAADGASMEDHPNEGGASDMFTGGKSTGMRSVQP